MGSPRAVGSHVYQEVRGGGVGAAPPRVLCWVWSLLRTPGVPSVTPPPDLILPYTVTFWGPQGQDRSLGSWGDPRGGWAAGHKAFASFSLDPQQPLCKRRGGSSALAALALRRIKDSIGCVFWAGPWGPLGLAHRRSPVLANVTLDANTEL